MLPQTIFAFGRPLDIEENELPSETIPEQSYPLSEILRRAAQGMPIPCREAEYDEEAEPNSADLNFDRTNTYGLDLTELQLHGEQVGGHKTASAAPPAPNENVPDDEQREESA